MLNPKVGEQNNKTFKLNNIKIDSIVSVISATNITRIHFYNNNVKPQKYPNIICKIFTVLDAHD